MARQPGAGRIAERRQGARVTVGDASDAVHHRVESRARSGRGLPVDMTGARRFGTLWGRAAACALGLGLGLLLVEGGGRLMPCPPTSRSAEYVALTRRVGPLPPSCSAVVNSSAGEFHQKVRFNALGLRGPTTQFSPDAGRRPRVLVLGDSYAAAWQVDLAHRFTERLERLKPHWSVLNLAMPNWGTDQEYLLLVSYPLAQAPDLVILLLTPLNDVADNGRAVLVGPPGRPHFVPAASGEALREIPWVYRDPFDNPGRHPFPLNVRTWLSLHSMAYRSGRDLWRLVDGTSSGDRPPPVPAAAPDTIPFEYGAFMVRPIDPRWEIAWTITERLIALVGRAARAQGADFQIVLIPHYATVQPELTPSFVGARAADPDLTRAHARVTSIAQAQGVPLLDLTPGFIRFREADPKGQALFFARDKHFTPLGHCLTGALVAQWLVPTTGDEALTACHREPAGS